MKVGKIRLTFKMKLIVLTNKLLKEMKLIGQSSTNSVRGIIVRIMKNGIKTTQGNEVYRPKFNK